MKKKGKIIILIITLLTILSLFFLSYILFRHKQSLSIEEKKWIDNNKNDVIDISILNNIPALTYNGNGVVFDFLDYISKETNLSFNPTAFNLSDTNLNNYLFTIKDKLEKNDLLFYRDNYILVNLDGSVVSNLEDIYNYKIAILSNDQEKFQKYFNQTNQLIGYNTQSDLFNKVKTDGINAIILLKTDLMQYICNNKLNISYQFIGETKDYVLTLNGDTNLNSIITKYYDRWHNNHLETSYLKHLLDDYYEFYNISNLNQTDLKSKTYVYGFVEDGIFDRLSKGNLVGINNIILKSFADFSKVEIEYKKYNSISQLIADYENGKIDILFNNISSKLKKDSFYTKTSFQSDIAVVSKYNVSVEVKTKEDLKNYKVVTIKDSKIQKFLKDNNVKYTTYNNVEDLFKKINKDSIIVLDFKNFEYYKTRNFKNYKIDAILDNINYNYVINNSASNSTFISLFDFYTNYINMESLIATHYNEISYKTINYTYISLIVCIILVFLLVLTIINKIRLFIKKCINSRKSHLTKEEKLKYIDQLTSLKNRTYLNSKVEEWDNSEVYPQCIIVIDLNNIAYINDNYGREEGDKIILQAANILIMSQLPNTEIIRTDGNEFLIYLVGYPEKTVIAYIRKLTRAFKNLDHGFGAASGYSMITDAIKTFDDAVNEATIDMRDNKDGN